MQLRYFKIAKTTHKLSKISTQIPRLQKLIKKLPFQIGVFSVTLRNASLQHLVGAEVRLAA